MLSTGTKDSQPTPSSVKFIIEYLGVTEFERI